MNSVRHGVFCQLYLKESVIVAELTASACFDGHALCCAARGELQVQARGEAEGYWQRRAEERNEKKEEEEQQKESAMVADADALARILQPGTAVRHPSSGRGTIVRITDDGRRVVEFANGESHRYARHNWHKLVVQGAHLGAEDVKAADGDADASAAATAGASSTPFGGAAAQGAARGGSDRALWEEATDPVTGDRYYWNRKTLETTWSLEELQ